MTRASLLHILDHVGGIPEAEIRELEQLAAAFPYCQTAHVLLAKADHDRGSMLASQRLRRAATYAADRQLLRQLLEQPVPERLAASAPQHLVGSAASHASAPAPSLGGTAAFLQTLEPEDVLPQEGGTEPDAADGSSATLVADDDTKTTGAAAEAAILAEADAPLVAGATLDGLAEAPGASDAFRETSPEPTPKPAAETATPVPIAADSMQAGATPVAEATSSATSATAESSAEETLTSVVLPAEAAESAAEPAAPETTTTSSPAPNNTDAVSEELPPVVAPPIRPPAEAGISRFEFGLAEPEALPEPSSYQLPGLDPGSDHDDLELLLPAAPRPLIPPFHTDAALAYALLGGGSRLGYALQMQEGELTTGLPADEFFEPDALLQAHAAAHQPRRRAPSSLDLIDRFLQNQPRLKSAARRPPPAEEQDDLSVRSTSVVPQLASESLAKIMVRQGKIDKAIEIYERLMVRQPEKSAYFTDQIHQLQTPE